MDPAVQLVRLIGIAFLGGVIPVLVWLAFWLREDRCQPEPKRRIALTFLCGMLAVAVAIPLETYVSSVSTGNTTLFVWAFIEEGLKIVAAALFGLLSADFDEPVDAVVYMVTAALGFAAAENILFLIGSLGQGNIWQSAVVGDTRFIGATLLHTLASATVGLAMAFSFYRSPFVRHAILIAGVILAVFLHAFFNFFILAQGNGALMSIFLYIWVGIICVLFFIERVKTTKDYC